MIERTPSPAHPTIVEYPDVNGGYPVVAPTRIAVRLVVEAFRELGDLDQTFEAFPQLTQEQVRAALDYYRAAPERVDEDCARNARALRSIRTR